MQLTDDQENACTKAMDWLSDKTSKYMVIQGDSGTGKSTLVRTLLKRIRMKEDLLATILGSAKGVDKWQIDMVATTNKACGVLAEMSGDVVKTLHSYLNLVPRPNYDTGELDFIKGRNYEIIYNRLIIIDESSMINDEEFELLDETAQKCKIILVGDQYQLAPVGQEKSIMEALDCPKAFLSTIVRHDSAIAQLGQQCKQMVKTGGFTGMRPNNEDIVYMEPGECLETVNDIFSHKDYTMDTARILAWTNKSVVKYNTHIRIQRGMHEPILPGETLITNKPIMTTKGTLASTDTRVKIDGLQGEEIQLGVPGMTIKLYGSSTRFFMPSAQSDAKMLLRTLKKNKQWTEYWHVKNAWLDLRPIFASTVHKSQGSTFETVFVDLNDIGRCFTPNDVARMLYVATTRASKKVIFFGRLPAKYGGIIHDYRRAAAAA